jgi:hypothetical protein
LIAENERGISSRYSEPDDTHSHRGWHQQEEDSAVENYYGGDGAWPDMSTPEQIDVKDDGDEQVEEKHRPVPSRMTICAMNVITYGSRPAHIASSGIYVLSYQSRADFQPGQQMPVAIGG